MHLRHALVLLVLHCKEKVLRGDRLMREDDPKRLINGLLIDQHAWGTVRTDRPSHFPSNILFHTNTKLHRRLQSSPHLSRLIDTLYPLSLYACLRMHSTRINNRPK